MAEVGCLIVCAVYGVGSRQYPCSVSRNVRRAFSLFTGWIEERQQISPPPLLVKAKSNHHPAANEEEEL